MTLIITLLALIVERFAGYPDALYRAAGHPVTWIGSLIAYLDRRFNRPSMSDVARRACGIAALGLLLLLTLAVGVALHWMLGGSIAGIAILALLASSLPAQKSLEDHVRAVADALEEDGLVAGRRAVSMIVGRDPDRLDEAAVCRAAIESLAENFSDGVVAPAVWLGLGGLPGGLAYKAVNTADSMIGHKTPRHAMFGWASARFDDLVNLPASRLTALLVIAAAVFVPGASAGGAWRSMLRDAGGHRSPNAGWPEAAVAGALGLALAGPRVYGGVMVDDATMGSGGRREATAEDIRRALALYRMADGLLIGLFALLAGIWWLALS